MRKKKRCYEPSVLRVDSSNKIATFEIIEEILFRVGETRVGKRGRESVEVEGRIHVSVVGGGQGGKEGGL